MNSQKNKGFTLVEVLVAIAIGAFLLSMVVTVFLGSRATSIATTGIARSQESTRFASFFIDRDLRMSGFSGCAKGISIRNFMNSDRPEYSPSLEDGIFGWEFAGTDNGDTYALDYVELGKDFTQAELEAARDSNSTGAANWTGQTSRGVGSVSISLPAGIAALRPLRGSDIVVMSISEPLTTRLTSNPKRTVPVINVVDINGTPTASDIEPGTMLRVGDCASVDIFQNAAAQVDDEISAKTGSGIGPGNRLGIEWQKKWGEESTVYQTRTVVYYVGTGSSGKPALFSFSTRCGLSNSCGATPTELVDGVENMQILYGEDTNSENLRDDVSNIYRSADQIEDYRRVVSMKVGLIVRSPDAGLDINEDTVFPEYQPLDQITIDTPDDANQRFANSSTIRLRNRGL